MTTEQIEQIRKQLRVTMRIASDLYYSVLPLNNRVLKSRAFDNMCVANQAYHAFEREYPCEVVKVD